MAHHFRTLKDPDLKKALDFEAQQRDQQIPFGKFQFVDVLPLPGARSIPANTDIVISHQLNPTRPDQVRYMAVRNVNNGPQPYDISPRTTPWTTSYIVLRFTGTGTKIRLLLFLESAGT